MNTTAKTATKMATATDRFNAVRRLAGNAGVSAMIWTGDVRVARFDYSVGVARVGLWRAENVVVIVDGMRRVDHRLEFVEWVDDAETLAQARNMARGRNAAATRNAWRLHPDRGPMVRV